jgi:hypothetical protein
MQAGGFFMPLRRLLARNAQQHPATRNELVMVHLCR